MTAKTSVYEPGADNRLDFIFDHLQRSLRVKADKWQKMLADEKNDYRTVVMDFLEKPEREVRCDAV